MARLQVGGMTCSSCSGTGAPPRVARPCCRAAAAAGCGRAQDGACRRLWSHEPLPRPRALSAVITYFCLCCRAVERALCQVAGASGLWVLTVDCASLPPASLSAVERALRQVAGVLDASVNLLTGVVEVGAWLTCLAGRRSAALPCLHLRAHLRVCFPAHPRPEPPGPTPRAPVLPAPPTGRCGLTPTSPAPATCWRLCGRWASPLSRTPSSAWVSPPPRRQPAVHSESPGRAEQRSARADSVRHCTASVRLSAGAHPSADLFPPAAAADFVAAGRAEAARWRRAALLAAALTLPVFLSSMVLPMAWPAAAAWLAGHTVRMGGRAPGRAQLWGRLARLRIPLLGFLSPPQCILWHLRSLSHACLPSTRGCWASRWTRDEALRCAALPLRSRVNAVRP